MRINADNTVRVNRHDRKRGMGPKEPTCPNCKQGLWPNNSFSLTREEASDLGIPLVEGKPPIFCRTCEAEVGRVIYSRIEELLEEGERVVEWFEKGQRSLHIHPDQVNMIFGKVGASNA